MMQSVVSAIQDLGCEVHIIPGGCTGLVQPVDVGANKPFKDRVRNNVEEFLTNQPIGAKPTRPIVSSWIGNAWDDLPCDILQRTWKKIGFGIDAVDSELPASQDSSFDDDHHDPLAMVPVNTFAINDDDAYNTDDSLEF